MLNFEFSDDKSAYLNCMKFLFYEKKPATHLQFIVDENN